MKVEFEPKFKIGQKVWLIEYVCCRFREYSVSEYKYEVKEYIVSAYMYYNKNDIRYIINCFAYREKDIYTDYELAKAKAKELNK